MTRLEDAMRKQMRYIILEEKRPFSYKDFLRFEVEGEEHYMAFGTVRNKILKFKKLGEIEVAYKTNIAFYTLKGQRFSKQTITPYHTGGINGNNYINGDRTSNNYLYNLIIDLPLDKNSIHDIRLNFTVKGLWSVLLQECNDDSDLSMYSSNKDICISTWRMNNLLARVIVHKTDKISVIIGCSLVPIILDVHGICRLVEVLTRIEERLYYIVKDYMIRNNKKTLLTNTLIIPHHTAWIVTMWHFGADSLTQATGEKFSITFKDTLNILYRVYTKTRQLQNRKKGNKHETAIRIEKQEYLRRSFQDAINERLFGNSS